MKKTAECLTNYIMHNGLIKKEEQEVFMYGFQTTLEIFLCVFISFILSYTFGMVAEGILFFLIFIPLRSYAGGLHLNHYWTCLFLSCMSFSVILLISKYVYLRAEISFVAVLVLELGIFFMYPVENKNRDVDPEEDVCFKKKLKSSLLLDLFITLVCMFVNKDSYLLLSMTTLLMVAVTMAIGKYKNCKHS